MTDRLRLNDYSWHTIEAPGDMPLIIASRAFGNAQTCLQNPQDIVGSFPDAEYYHCSDPQTGLAEKVLVIGMGSPRGVEISGTNDGALAVSAKWRKRIHTVSTEMMRLGPEPVGTVEFTREGAGKKYARIYSENFLEHYSAQDVLMCWTIANVAMRAMLELDFYLARGRWPNL